MSSSKRPTRNVPKADSYLISQLLVLREVIRGSDPRLSAGRRLPSGLNGGACDSRSFQRCCVTLVRCAAAAVLASSLRQRRGAVLASSLASGVARRESAAAIMLRLDVKNEVSERRSRAMRQRAAAPREAAENALASYKGTSNRAAERARAPAPHSLAQTFKRRSSIILLHALAVGHWQRSGRRGTTAQTHTLSAAASPQKMDSSSDDDDASACKLPEKEKATLARWAPAASGACSRDWPTARPCGSAAQNRRRSTTCRISSARRSKRRKSSSD